MNTDGSLSNPKNEPDRMAVMLRHSGGRGYQVEEDSVAADGTKNDSDFDSDFDKVRYVSRLRGLFRAGGEWC